MGIFSYLYIMKRKIISTIALIGVILLSGCGINSYEDRVSLIGKNIYHDDTSVIISTSDNQTFKITDTTVIKWDTFLFIYSKKDTSSFKRDVFVIYDKQKWSTRYTGGTYVYLTNGKSNLMFDGDESWQNDYNAKIGDRFYVFYKTGSTFQTEEIK